jgi:hypothetical protein
MDWVAATKTIRGALEDLAQPLAVVTGTVDLLQLELNQKSEFVDALHSISEQLEYIMQIFDGIWKTANRSANTAMGVDMDKKNQLDELYTQEPQVPKSIEESPITRENKELVDDLSIAFKNIRIAVHALAQPLVVLTGTIDLLLLEMDQESPYYEEVQNTSEQLERIVKLIAEIRGVARQVSEALQESKVEDPDLPEFRRE